MKYVIKHPIKGYFCSVSEMYTGVLEWTEDKDETFIFSSKKSGLDYMSANPEFLSCILEVV
jgi:hypothetical protein